MRREWGSQHALKGDGPCVVGALMAGRLARLSFPSASERSHEQIMWAYWILSMVSGLTGLHSRLWVGMSPVLRVFVGRMVTLDPVRVCHSRALRRDPALKPCRAC